MTKDDERERAADRECEREWEWEKGSVRRTENGRERETEQKSEREGEMRAAKCQHSSRLLLIYLHPSL